MRGRAWTALVTSLAITGCASLPAGRYEKSAQVDWADDAGSVNVAHIASLRWEEAASLLQPKFPMSSEAALAAALPTTQTLDERLADIITANLQVALPTSAKTVTTTESGAPGATTTSTESVTTRESGDASKVSPATLPGGTAAALAGLGQGIGISQDPMLRHLAATALYQEVNLLNRYVSDAVRYRGAQAYLVRLQLSVLPSRRALPYDVTTDITIHADDMQAQAGLAAPRFDEAEAEKAAWLGATPEEQRRLNARVSAYASQRDEKVALYALNLVPAAGAPQAVHRCTGTWNKVNVVPLVVTDNLESLAAARASDTVRQLGLALLATAGNVGASGQFARTQQALRREEGRDTNSLLTVARLTDDTVRVRLGAAQSPRYGNTMLPRTHNISLLVIYQPCAPEVIDPSGEERILSAVTKASFTDIFTGRTLPYRNAGRRLLALSKELNHKYNNRFTYLEYAGLYQLVSQQRRSDYQQFFADKITRYKDAGPRGCEGLSPSLGLLALFAPKGISGKMTQKDLDSVKTLYGDKYKNLRQGCMSEQLAFEVASAGLWTELESIRPISEFSYTNIPIVLRKVQPSLPDKGQTVLLSKGESAVTATLFQGRDLSLARDLRATLELSDKVIVPSNAAKVSADGTSVALSFPLFPAIKRTADVKEPTVDKLTLRVGAMDDGRPLPQEQEYASLRFIEIKPAAAKPAYVLSAPAPAIVVDATGKGRLAIMVKAEKVDTAPAKPTLTVEGAEVVGVARSGANLAATTSGWPLSGAGEYVLTLDNLVPGQSVSVGVVDDKDEGASSIAAKLTRPIYGRLVPAKEP